MTKNFPYLTHPYVLFALSLTLLNDHYLKHQFHSTLTGKISDFSGLFFFPLFAYALFEFLKRPGTVHVKIEKKDFFYAIVLTDMLFIILKFSFLRDYFVSAFSAYVFKIQITPDVSDLAAISMNFLTYRFARRFF